MIGVFDFLRTVLSNTSNIYFIYHKLCCQCHQCSYFRYASTLCGVKQYVLIIGFCYNIYSYFFPISITIDSREDSVWSTVATNHSSSQALYTSSRHGSETDYVGWWHKTRQCNRPSQSKFVTALLEFNYFPHP